MIDAFFVQCILNEYETLFLSLSYVEIMEWQLILDVLSSLLGDAIDFLFLYILRRRQIVLIIDDIVSIQNRSTKREIKRKNDSS